MSTTNNGGPAFPVHDLQSAVPHTTEEALAMARGMSLRDYFAASVDVAVYMPYQTFKDSKGRHPTIGELAEYIASIRVIEADAMLAAREKGGAA